HEMLRNPGREADVPVLRLVPLTEAPYTGAVRGRPSIEDEEQPVAAVLDLFRVREHQVADVCLSRRGVEIRGESSAGAECGQGQQSEEELRSFSHERHRATSPRTDALCYRARALRNRSRSVRWSALGRLERA